MLANIPELSLVVLVGPSGSGKSTFARTHFKPTEILSSDACRAMVSDDENDQSATDDAFDLLHFIARKRLAAGKLTVVDATNVQPAARQSLIALAKEYHCLVVAIVLDMPAALCYERNGQRPDRNFGPHVIRNHISQLKRSLPNLRREGFHQVITLSSPEQVAGFRLERQPLWNNRKQEHGPFDIVGDVHGCFDELLILLDQLGYQVGQDAAGTYLVTHPAGRKLVFVGDLVDRGPRVPSVLRLVMDAVAAGQALCVPGNHDAKLQRKLAGRDVQVSHGLAATLEQLATEPPAFVERVRTFLDGLVSHYVLDDGKLVVAHAGLPASMHGRGSAKVRDFALYGETTGETDEFGLPIRYNWAADYRGQAVVVYGHTPIPEPEWLNQTLNIDTGCVFGGRLTALRYPERELVSVPARQTYCEPVRPISFTPAPELTAQQEHDDLLDVADILGKRIVETALHGRVTVREENALAALEAMSRFAANPKWLIYLPPTMSPAETSHEPGTLEHPAEAFAYYREQGVHQVVCEQKHMGSRAVVIVCRDEAAAQRRFGVIGEGIGICYTRTGRHFFTDRTLEAAFLDRVRMAIDHAGLWEQLQTDWLCLDCELMPWSMKAQELLRTQYAAVGAAARVGLQATESALAGAAANGIDVATLQARYGERLQHAQRFTAAYRRYCWPVESLADLKLAPFHLLASEGAVHANKDHRWHMQVLGTLGAADPELLLATPYQVVHVHDPESVQAGVQWWEELTGRGDEGMVVKPLDFVVRGAKGLVQPAIKVRGREYLRIIYGPEYTLPENLERLRRRGLSGKRSLALREFALGVEGLQRFVQAEPLRRVHECVHAVLALESEPIDPRL